MRRKLLKIAAVLLPPLILFGWLFLGIFRDRESGTRRLFVKHKPTFKFSFHTPLGKSDKTLNELNPEQSHEEVMYREYIEEQGGYGRSLSLGL